MQFTQNITAVLRRPARFGLGCLPVVVALLVCGLWRGQIATAENPFVVAQAQKTKKPKAESKKSAPAKAPKNKADDADEAADNDGPATPLPPVEYETVTLADGTKIEVEKWGKTFLGYDYQPPIEFGDHRLKEIVQYEKLGHHNVPIMAIQVDPEHKRIYWCDGNSFHAVGHLWSANLDGGDIRMLAEHRPRPRNLVLDGEQGKLYWLEGLSNTGAVMTCDIHGKNMVTLIDRLKTPFGLAIDAERGELYYFEEHHIVRVKTDGTGETLIVNGPRDTGPYAYVMEFDAAEDRLFWVVGHDFIRRVNRDGSGLVPYAMRVHPLGDAEGFALDIKHKKFYFLDSSYGRVERANFDGTQREALVAFPIEDSVGFHRGTSGGLAVDPHHGQLYFAGGKGMSTTDSPRIYQMSLPPVLPPKERPAPPLITAILTGEYRAGTEVSVTGRHMEHTTAVSLVDDSTCRHVSAKFRVVDDQTLIVTVPKLSEACSHPVIIVQTPSGVTMTLRKYLKTIKSEAHYKHDRFVAGTLPQLWMMSNSSGGLIELALTYVNSKCSFAAKGRGANTVFAKNGSLIRLSFLTDSVIYHEPFMIASRMPRMLRNPKELSGLELIPVPAIRPSFVDQLMTYQHDDKANTESVK